MCEVVLPHAHVRWIVAECRENPAQMLALDNDCRRIDDGTDGAAIVSSGDMRTSPVGERSVELRQGLQRGHDDKLLARRIRGHFPGLRRTRAARQLQCGAAMLRIA